MLPQHTPLRQAFGAGRDHVLLADFFQKRVLGQHGGGRKTAQHHGRDRQRDVPQVVRDAGAPAELLPVPGCQAAQRKPLQLPAKHDQERHTQHKARNRVAHQHQDGGQHIKARACTHGLGHAQWHGHQIADEKSPQAQAHGHGQLLPDELRDIAVLKKAFAQVKACELRQHLPKTLGRGLVKAVQRFGLFNALGVHALRAPVAQASPFGTAAGACFGFGQVLLHRPPGHKLDHDKGQQQDAQQGGHHQHQAFQDVEQHGQRAHQVSMAQVSPWA